MTTTFETSKELAKYVRIETKFIWKDGSTLIGTRNTIDIPKNSLNIKQQIPEEILSKYIVYPAPTLEELLKVSPIDIIIGSRELQNSIHYRYRDNKGTLYTNPLGFQCSKSESLVESVAKIILEYYRGKE